MRPFVLLVAAAVGIALLTLFILRGDPADPEEQVRLTLQAAVEATQQKDLGALLDLVSERFETPEMNRQQLKGLLFMQLRRGDWSKVVLVDTHIEILAGERQARVKTGAVLATGEGGIVPTDAGSYRFDIRLDKEDDDEWRVVGAKHVRAPAGNPFRTQ